MNDSVVYVVTDPGGKEISLARDFGKLHVILTGKEDRLTVMDKLNDALSKMRPQDYLLPIGSPINMGIAFHFAFIYCDGSVQVLSWDRQAYKYNEETITIEYDTN